MSGWDEGPVAELRARMDDLERENGRLLADVHEAEADRDRAVAAVRQLREVLGYAVAMAANGDIVEHMNCCVALHLVGYQAKDAIAATAEWDSP